jgi:hypothetical protein
MTPAQRREARVALAMLPVGAIVTVFSFVAFFAVLAFALSLPWRGAWYWVWTAGALAVAGRNTLAGIAIMSSFDWRRLPSVLILSALVLAGWLALP